VSDWWDRPWRQSATEEPRPTHSPAAPETGGRSVCPWCSAVAEPDAGHCPSCGAVMAQRESLGGLVVPGVTDVDPALARPSATGSFASAQARVGLHAAAVDPRGAVVIGAVMAARAVGDMFKPEIDPKAVGQVSRAALEMVERLDGEEAPGASSVLALPEPSEAESSPAPSMPGAWPESAAWSEPDLWQSPEAQDAFGEPNTLSGDSREPNTLSGDSSEPNTLSGAAE
jgi:hypothetical protein